MNLEEAKTYEQKELLTLGIVLEPNRILLAIKKKGFGVGWWNGYGGHVEPNESIENCLIRESGEEGLIESEKISKRGTLWFEFENDATIREVHVFQIVEYKGEPGESEEMCPKWFPLDGIPYDKMWPADEHWIPFFLEGKTFEGYFFMNEDKKLLDHNVLET